MRRIHVRSALLALLFIATNVWSADVCPDALNLLHGDEQQALSTLEAVNQRKLDAVEPDQCLPKASAHIAVGYPLCALEGKISTLAASVISLSENGLIVFLGYTFEYSPEVHEQLYKILLNKYALVTKEHYPPEMKQIGIHEELTALFEYKDVYIALQKTGRAMPGRWFSKIVFERKQYLQISRRDVNRCK